MMKPERKVKDVMSPIEEYLTVDQNAPLCDAVALLRMNFEKMQKGEGGKFHKTLMVLDGGGEIVGKLTVFDLIRGLVPHKAKEQAVSKAFYRILSERSLAVAEEVDRLRERFDWLEKSFSQLVREETHKKIGEVMSMVHPVLEEEDTLNKAVYVMFKDNIRQPMVVREGKIVGVISIMDIFPVLLEIAGESCIV